MFAKVLNMFEKKEEPEPTSIPDMIDEIPPVDNITSGPDLMASDPFMMPSRGPKVDLMADDPAYKRPANEAPQRVNQYVEQPGLEKQLAAKPMMMEPQQVAEITTATQMGALDAFSMAAPMPNVVSQAPHTQPTKSDIEMLDITAEINLESTQKICSCGTPNDPLAKFCVSCGKTYE